MVRPPGFEPGVGLLRLIKSQVSSAKLDTRAAVTVQFQSSPPADAGLQAR